MHDEAFYRLYHDASEKLGEVAAAMAGHYLRRLRKKSGEMPAAVLRAAALQTEATTLDAAYEAMSEHHAARRERVRQAVSDALEPKVPGGEPMEARACPPANP